MIETNQPATYNNERSESKDFGRTLCLLQFIENFFSRSLKSNKSILGTHLKVILVLRTALMIGSFNNTVSYHQFKPVITDKNDEKY